jgi:hypothetical protein
MILIKTNPVKNTLLLDKGMEQGYNFHEVSAANSETFDNVQNVLKDRRNL